MSLLSSLLGDINEKIPDNVGKAYDKTLGVGSWVISGIADYKRWTEDNFARIKNQIDRYFNFKRDPAKALWLADMLLREDPVKIPEYMSSDDWNMLQKIIGFFKGEKYVPGEPSVAHPELYESDSTISVPDEFSSSTRVLDGYATDESDGTQVKDRLLTGSTYDKLTDNADYADKMSEDGDVSYYTNLVSVYGDSKLVKSPKDAVRWAVEELGISSGYSELAGFEPGSDHQWSIQLYPYNGPGRDNIGEIYSDFSLVPALPEYELPKVISKPITEGAKASDYYGNSRFSFGKQCPCLSYNLSFGNQETKDISLFNNSKIQIPLGFSYNINLQLSIIDDVHGSMKKYMNKYFNMIYSLRDASLARYDMAAFVIRLVILKPGYKTKWDFKFIGVPYNYTPQFEGSEDANPSTISIDFSIVGMVQPTNEYTDLDRVGSASMPQNYNWDQSTWTDVIIAPNSRLTTK